MRVSTGSRSSYGASWGARHEVAAGAAGAASRARSPASSTTSSASVTHTATPSRSSRWHPVDAIDVTGPGTAPTGRESSAARDAVLSEPERQAASTTTVARANAAMSRLRSRNRTRLGTDPGGTSETTAPPDSTTERSSSTFPAG